MNSCIQKEKAAQFRSFHQGPPLLVPPNVWDAASARIIEQAGFRAIATTSSGVAATLGYSDGQLMSREMMTLLSRSNSQYLWRALKHARGYTPCCYLVKSYAIDERNGHGNNPDPFRVKY